MEAPLIRGFFFYLENTLFHPPLLKIDEILPSFTNQFSQKHHSLLVK